VLASDEEPERHRSTEPIQTGIDPLCPSSATLSTVQPTTNMFTCFEDSVLASADKDGNLSLSLTQQLLSEHGFTLTDTYADPHGVDPVALDARNAQALLHWLGY